MTADIQKRRSPRYNLRFVLLAFLTTSHTLTQNKAKNEKGKAAHLRGSAECALMSLWLKNEFRAE